MKRSVEGTSGEGRGSGARGPLALNWPPSAEDLEALEVFELRNPGEPRPLLRSHPRAPRAPGISPPRYVPGPGYGAPKVPTPGPTGRLEPPLVWPPPEDDDLPVVAEPPAEAVAAQVQVVRSGVEGPLETATPREAPTPNVLAALDAVAVSGEVPATAPRRHAAIGRTLAVAASLLLALGGAFLARPFMVSWPFPWPPAASPAPAFEPVQVPPSGVAPGTLANGPAEGGGAAPTMPGTSVLPPAPSTPPPGVPALGQPAVPSVLPPAGLPPPRPAMTTRAENATSTPRVPGPAPEVNSPRDIASPSEATVPQGAPTGDSAAPPPTRESPTPVREGADRTPAGEVSAAASPPPTAAPVVSPASPPATPAARDGQADVREALASYRAAYGSLDASAARRVWPNVDEAALARAFADLKSQRIEFDSCDIVTQADTATANCQGRAVYVRQVGRQDPQVEPRRWLFTLRPTAAGWRIERAEIRR